MSQVSIRLLYLESLGLSRKYGPRPKPDGHFGWVTVGASACVSMLADGYAYTAGQFYQQFLIIYGKSETITSLFISIMNGTIYMISPFVSGLINVYGCRTVSTVGTIMATSGMILSCIFDQSIYFHCLFIGFTTGLGIGMLFLSQVVVVTYWFNQKIALATGLAECGSGFGMAAFAVISNHFIRLYTWKGAILILAGLMSTGFIFSSLYAEPTCPENEITQFVGQSQLALQTPGTIEDKSLGSFTRALKETINFSLLRTNKSYLLFVISQFVLSLVFFMPVIVIADRMNRAHFSDQRNTSDNGASIYVCFGVASGFGRILFGWISTNFEVNNLWLMITETIGLGISIIITNLANSAAVMRFYYSMIGIFFGANVCLCSVVVVDMLGHSKMANAYGIISFFNGIAALIGPPLLNLTVDHSGQDIYATAMWICGSITILSVIFLLPIFYLDPFYNGTSSRSPGSVIIKIHNYSDVNRPQEQELEIELGPISNKDKIG